MVLFTYAAVGKLVDMDAFRFQLEQGLLPSDWALLVVWSIPCIELFIVLLFLFPKANKIALYASLALLVFFTTYIIVLFMGDGPLPCSCGGVINELGWWEHLFLNLFLIGVCVLGIWIQNNPKGQSI
jgi:hypothetical protein